jgi:hypothetical protein
MGTRIAAILDALVDGISARPAFAGVQVRSAFMGDEMDGREFVVFDGTHRLDGDWSSIGRLSRQEIVTVDGSVVVRYPGGGEQIVRAARSRAAALFADIESFVTASVANNRLMVNGVPTVHTSKIRPTGYADGFDPDGRVAVLTFSVECESRLLAQ